MNNILFNKKLMRNSCFYSFNSRLLTLAERNPNHIPRKPAT